MYRLLINLYEFGQFLRILLWVSVPLVVLSMLITTWLHYRRKRRLPEDLFLSLNGMEAPDGLALPPFLLSSAEFRANGQEPLDEADPGHDSPPEKDHKENIYRGILWMKEKYEQYRDMADNRYHQLKEELARTEKKYQDLLESGIRPAGATGTDIAASPAAHPASNPAEGRESRSRMLEMEELQLRNRYLLEEKQAYIDQLEGQLVSERQKIEELVAKLQASSQQLLFIYEELDRSLKPTNSTGEPLNSPSES